jgi:hypothetical protein
LGLGPLKDSNETDTARLSLVKIEKTFDFLLRFDVLGAPHRLCTFTSPNGRLWATPSALACFSAAEKRVLGPNNVSNTQSDNNKFVNS